jgi:hypothetical protein
VVADVGGGDAAGEAWAGCARLAVALVVGGVPRLAQPTTSKAMAVAEAKDFIAVLGRARRAHAQDQREQQSGQFSG